MKMETHFRASALQSLDASKQRNEDANCCSSIVPNRSPTTNPETQPLDIYEINY